ncbi:dienelactone hydrolase family protein [Pseudoduganella sp. GCM10020061]|uniref:dienelactone hydrolase family protein n=1 Tax=Pseudoduganella sp. GCM10020061 TaxID=3317345 RepID=UPI0036272AE9
MDTDRDNEVTVWCGSIELGGSLGLPQDANGVILFAHGSGSSRHSPRNNQVARTLRQHGLGTLLLDLLTPEEDRDARKRFDIALLTERLRAAREWLRDEPDTSNHRVGLFGASTGAAAALQLAAALGHDIAAVVSRGGRPDMAGEAELDKVSAPTLLIVGGEDGVVIDLNRQAFAQLNHCEKELVIIPGATHLFEEPGKMDQVAALATDWFARHCRTLI